MNHVLHVKLGIGDLGDGRGPWLPTEDEKAEIKQQFEDAVGDGVNVVVTHFGVETQQLPTYLWGS